MHGIFVFLLFLLYNLKVLLLCCVPNRFRSKKDVSGQIALITGAGSGFGRIYALRFAKLGCRIVACDVNRSNNQETCRLVQQAGGQATGYYCDVSDRQAVYDLAKKVKTEVGEVDILINNAGIATGETLLETKDEDIEKLIGVNLLAHFWTTKAFLPDMMKKNKGHLVHVASLAGIVGGPKLTDYAASKHGVMGFAESLQMELIYAGYDGIKVTVSCPYFCRTGIFEGSYDGIVTMPTPEEVVDDVVNGVLLDKDIVYSPRGLWSLWFLRPLTSKKSMMLLSTITVGEKLLLTGKAKKVDFSKLK